VVFERLFAQLATGFLEDYGREISQPVDEEVLKKTYRGTLALLYRLLFLLYAEARDLLPHRDRLGYGVHSITRLKRDVAARLDEGERFSDKSYVIWERLESIFRIVDEGSKELNVPPYNGGLFKDAGSHELLGTHRVSDRHLAPALDELSRQEVENGERRFVDYGFIGVRELGSVYEGLLEFSLRIAERGLVVVKEKGKEVYVPKGSQKKKKVLGSVKKGEPYLVNDKKERKATGAYYTPRYIVDYIVETTLGPLVAERCEALKERLGEIERLRDDLQRAGNNDEYVSREVRKMEALRTLLDVKVLDPAMGSGHFLVAAVDYLTDEFSRIIAELDAEPVVQELADLRAEIRESLEAYGASASDEQLSDANLLKRMVLKRCIYGVDLNEMAVELAKLSLWLDAFTVGVPLSFLHHHLKHGNSLIGSSVREVRREVETSGSLLGNQFTATLIQGTELMQHVGEIPDATEGEVRESIDAYAKADKVLTPHKRMLDIWTSQHFGNRQAERFLSITSSTGAVDQLTKGIYKHFAGAERKIIDAAKNLSEAKRFFHWELEFPEVFFEGARERENPGFDAVVGNPPYDVLAQKEVGGDTEAEVLYFRSEKSYEPALGGKLNYYKLFVVAFSQYVRREGRCGLIIPLSIVGDKSALQLRKYLISKTQIETIECFPQKDNAKDRVFEDAKLSACIVLWRREAPNEKFTIRTHPGKGIEATSRSSRASYEDVQLFDPEQLNIPNLNQQELNLALSLAKNKETVPFRSYADVIQGEINLTGDAKYIFTKPGENKIIRGAQVVRYRVSDTLSQGEPLFLDKDNFLKTEKPTSKAFAFQHRRIVFQRNTGVDDARRLHAALLSPGHFAADSLNFLSKNLSEIATYFLLAILNSSISEWRFRISSTNNHVNAYEIERIPTPQITAVTGHHQRELAVRGVIKDYQDREYTAMIKWVERELQWSSETNTSKAGRNDTVHDLLAYLAEQVTVMYKERAEIEATWREWVEATLPPNHNLTKIFLAQDWVTLGLELGWEGVKAEFQARNAIPSGKTLQDLRRETEEALADLGPLYERIRKTDELIDQIVYRLYGLSEDEIAVVEASVAGT
jgi:Alw26I/Eco31I/Esp3I family type II restriction m6 adenine DNA methyltransferase